MAHYLELWRERDGGLRSRLHRYYDLREQVQVLREELSGAANDTLVGLVGERLRQAVQLRLRSDVPVGISLSGGLDSSAVAALAAGDSRLVTGFVFGHRDAGGSEGPRAERLCQRAGIRVEYIWPTVKEVIEA